VDVAMNFPEECLYVLKVLKVIYTNVAVHGMPGKNLFA
jgi:hypothetical protein